MMEVTKVWWDGNKIMAEPVDPTTIYRDPAQQEPVAHFGSAYVNENGVHVTTVLGPVAIPQDAKLYTSQQPAQRTWVGLTDEEIDDIYMGAGKHDLIRAREIEAKLREKNA